MTELRIPLDPLNPGQFFACCGLLDLFTFDSPTVLGSFTADSFRPRVAEFVIQNISSELTGIIEQLKHASPEFFDDEGRIEAAVRPAFIPYGSECIELDWWLDQFRDDTTNLKCWAGQVTTRNLFVELLPLLDPQVPAADLFNTSALTKAKFGVDPRSAWNAQDFGFSPNEHGRDSATFPAVEILAAIGLQGFRPDFAQRDEVRYSLWTTPLPAPIARLAFREPWDGLPRRDYAFSIAKRGQSYKYFTFARNIHKESI